MMADKWTAKNEEAECADNDPEYAGSIDVDQLREIWNRLPFLKPPRNEEELEALMGFSEELYEAIEGDPSHPL